MRRGNLHPLYRGVYAVGHTNLTRRAASSPRSRPAGPAPSSPTTPRPPSTSSCTGTAARSTSPRRRSAAIRASTSTGPRRSSASSSRASRSRRSSAPSSISPRPPTRRRSNAPSARPSSRRANSSSYLKRILDLGADPDQEPARGSGPRPRRRRRPRAAAGQRALPAAGPHGLSRTCWWPSIRLIVEADSKTWHDDPLARYDDAERQAELEAAGERVLRVTTAQMRRPQQVARPPASGGRPERR